MSTSNGLKQSASTASFDGVQLAYADIQNGGAPLAFLTPPTSKRMRLFDDTDSVAVTSANLEPFVYEPLNGDLSSFITPHNDETVFNDSNIDSNFVNKHLDSLRQCVQLCGLDDGNGSIGIAVSRLSTHTLKACRDALAPASITSSFHTTIQSTQSAATVSGCWQPKLAALQGIGRVPSDNHFIPDHVLNREASARSNVIVQCVLRMMHASGDARDVSVHAGVIITDAVGKFIRKLLSDSTAGKSNELKGVSGAEALSTIICERLPLHANMLKRWISARDKAGLALELHDTEHNDFDVSPESSVIADSANIQNDITPHADPDSSNAASIISFAAYFASERSPSSTVVAQGKHVPGPKRFQVSIECLGVHVGPLPRFELIRQREKNWSLDAYEHLSACRRASFLHSRVRRTFLKWITLLADEVSLQDDSLCAIYDDEGRNSAKSEVTFNDASLRSSSLALVLAFLAWDRVGVIVDLARGVRQQFPEWNSDAPISCPEIQEALSLLPLYDESVFSSAPESSNSTSLATIPSSCVTANASSSSSSLTLPDTTTSNSSNNLLHTQLSQSSHENNTSSSAQDSAVTSTTNSPTLE